VVGLGPPAPDAAAAILDLVADGAFIHRKPRRRLMPYELFIGLRYLRAKRREAFVSLLTVFSAVGIAIGVMTLDIVLAVMTGFEEDLRDRIVGFNPHVLVMSQFGAIEDYEKLLDAVRSVDGVSTAAPFVYGNVMLSNRDHVVGVFVRGIVPDAAGAGDIGDRMVEGDVGQLARTFAVPLSDGRGGTTRLPGIVLGRKLAANLELEVGDAVSAAIPVAPDARSRVPRLRRLAVVGLFDSGMPEYDKAVAYLSLHEAQKLFGLASRVSSVEVKVDDLYAAPQIAEAIAETVGFPYRVRDWLQSNENLFAALRLQKTVYFIVLLLIVLVAAFTILATLIMVVTEKRRDVAILRSMGATSQSIRRIFMSKGLVIGVAGTVAGTALGLLGCLALRNYRFIDLPVDVFYVSTVPVRIYPEYFVLVAVCAFLISLLATLYPAYQASRLAPVEVLRYE
jgi:lipoprotein-releasing system permease protein